MLLIWRRWRGWRRGRPFWGGVFTVLAGVEIGVIPLAPMKVMLHQGPAGIPTVVLAAIIVILGLSAWFSPQYRGLAGVLTVVLAAAALALSNLGGFMIGTLLGVLGGALIFAWTPVPAAPPADAPDAERQEPEERRESAVLAEPASSTERQVPEKREESKTLAFSTKAEDSSTPPKVQASGEKAEPDTTLSSLASAFSVPPDDGSSKDDAKSEVDDETKDDDSSEVGDTSEDDDTSEVDDKSKVDVTSKRTSEED